LDYLTLGDVINLFPETSVTTSVRCVTYQKIKDLICTAAETSNQARQKFCLPTFSTGD